MKKQFARGFLLLAVSALFSGCVGMNSSQPPLTFTPHTFPAGDYTQKVDNFLLVLDASSTMGINGQRDFLTAKNLIGAINQSLPTDLDYNAGLRTFGQDSPRMEASTDLVYGMTRYTRSGLQQGLDGVSKTGGTSPLPKALEAAATDLKGAAGKTAVVIVSDGLEEASMGGAPAAAAKLRAALGDKLCTYTIAVGGDPVGEKYLQEVAKAGGCGFSVTAASLTSPDQLEAFVESVFLDRKMKSAAVVAAPPAAAKVMVDGDRDADGVVDSRDRCPDTPRGEIVDENGCTLKLTMHINFDFDKSDIKPEFAGELQKAADFILKNQDVPYIAIAGYTDAVGDDAYNQKLSERRAAAVRQYLIEKFGIDGKRLAAIGRGETGQVASNETDAGRYENRRVEVICCAVLPPS
ncbi:peptidoglycan-binding outer membrane protein [Desulfuromonas sp. DDH964]|nr:peptidoglycan-binding outer membrane protein [Desulfuromonas sp. DDH964]